jgi:glycosyltransferase involved in cell wall biosynthesis
LVKEFSTEYPFIKFISEPDKGIYDAMNKGIHLATEDYLYFMGSDDVFYNDRVLIELFGLSYFGEYDFIYGNFQFKHSGIKQGEEKNYLKLIKNLENINHQSIFYSKKIFDKIGDYDLRFPIYADFNLNIKCFRDESISKKYIDRTICIFNEKGTSFFHRNQDSYIRDLHEFYVNNHEDPVALYDTAKQLEGEIAKLLNSKDYRIGKKIGNFIRLFRRMIRSESN